MDDEYEKKLKKGLKDDLKKIGYKIHNSPDIFEKNEYLNSVVSKKNTYHIYRNNKSYTIITKIRTTTKSIHPKINYNIYTNEEIDEIKRHIKNNINYVNVFPAGDLVDKFNKMNKKSPRSIMLYKHYKNESSKNYAPYRFSNEYFLNGCYILTAMEWLQLIKKSNKILFTKGYPEQKKTIDPYIGMKYIGKEEKKYYYRDDRYFYIIRDEGNRGTISPYFPKEIKYLKKYVSKYRRNQLIDTDALLLHIDYWNRFKEINKLVGERDKGNERDWDTYFKLRINNSLRILIIKTKLVREEKKGRLCVFYKE